MRRDCRRSPAVALPVSCWRSVPRFSRTSRDVTKIVVRFVQHGPPARAFACALGSSCGLTRTRLRGGRDPMVRESSHGEMPTVVARRPLSASARRPSVVTVSRGAASARVLRVCAAPPGGAAFVVRAALAVPPRRGGGSALARGQLPG
jgi:hypothetical protein